MITEYLPKTDDDVFEKFKEYENDLLSKTLAAIYRCRRSMGDEVLAAYEYTLKAHIDHVTGP